jgi:hypothetical protein
VPACTTKACVCDAPSWLFNCHCSSVHSVHMTMSPSIPWLPGRGPNDTSATSQPSARHQPFDLFRALMTLAETHPEVFRKLQSHWSRQTTTAVQRSCSRGRAAVNQAIGRVRLFVEETLLAHDLAGVFPQARALLLDFSGEECAFRVGQWLRHLEEATPRLLQQLERAEVCVRGSHVEQGLLPGQLLSRCACLVRTVAVDSMLCMALPDPRQHFPPLFDETRAALFS